MSLLPPAQHGGDGARLARILGVPVDDVLDLSMSLNPVAPDLTPVLAAHLDSYRRYPDHERTEAALAEALGVDHTRVVLTNGGADAIALLADEWPIGWVDEPDFSLYASHLRTLEPGALTWRSNPHNPTGQLAAEDDRAGVWDEAFYPLATGRWSRRDAATAVVGSLTKVFACPGLRLGYVISPDDELAERLRARRSAWPVNGLAAEVLPSLLAASDLPKWALAIGALRAQLVDLLAKHGITAEPSAANYVWVQGAGDLRERLLAHAIALRSGRSFGAPDAVRIAVPDSEGLERLATALAQL